MNKNRKRLSKLLIPMLALTTMYVNAMETRTKNIHRSNSVNISTTRKKPSKPSKIGILIKNRDFEKNQQQYVIQYGGKALDKFNDKYEILPTSRHRKVITNLNLRGAKIFGEAAGHGGSVSQCRDRETGKIFAVKYTPNFKTTGIKTLNSEKAHSEDLNNEEMFSKDYKKYWSNKSWALKYYDFFRDENGAYAVTEWIDSEKGATLEDYLYYVKNNFNFTEKVGRFATIAKQFNQIIDDLQEQNKQNKDLHERNIMVIPNPANPKKPLLKVIDNGWYTDAEPNFETHSTNVLLHHFKAITSPKELHTLSKSNAKIYSKLKEALSCLNAEILDTQHFQIQGDADWYGNYTYNSQHRHEFVSLLNEIKDLGDQLKNSKK